MSVHVNSNNINQTTLFNQDSALLVSDVPIIPCATCGDNLFCNDIVYKYRNNYKLYCSTECSRNAYGKTLIWHNSKAMDPCMNCNKLVDYPDKWLKVPVSLGIFCDDNCRESWKQYMAKRMGVKYERSDIKRKKDDCCIL